MINTHGDLLYRPSAGTATIDPTINSSSKSNEACGNYRPPRGEVGWICPVCGRGLAPSTSYCPCQINTSITYINTTPNNVDGIRDYIEGTKSNCEIYGGSLKLDNLSATQ